MNCNHPVDQLMPSLDYKGALYCRKCEMRFKEKNGWYFEWKPEEKGECVEVEEYETEDCIGLRFSKGIEAKTFLAKVKKANQGGCNCAIEQNIMVPCPVHNAPQKPSEEERWIEFSRIVEKHLLKALGDPCLVGINDFDDFRSKFP